ncbi:hypothetical protein AB0K00_12680 [Dactylosporangium sp. NPDC049525]|uniref:hypothetical protein n=1 Tax=Dactylosporangium sp. NPDC049525 TaxID=3154730 RepID=UPI0034287EAA
MKLYISAELQPVLRALCAPSLVSARRVSPPSVSVQWQESAIRGAFAGVAAAPAPARKLSAAQMSTASLIPTVASAPAAAPIASFAVTGGVAALGGVEVPGGVEVQGGTATGVSRAGVSATGAFQIDLRVDMDADRVGGTVQHVGTEQASTTEQFSTTARVRIVEQVPAVGVALLDRREVQVQGTSGLTANDKHDLTAPKPNGGVRGTPPRGRPV